MVTSNMPYPFALCNTNRRKNRIAIADYIDRENSRKSSQPSGPVWRLTPGTCARSREGSRLSYAPDAWVQPLSKWGHADA